ncbi:MAG: recombinase family protein, partial [Peptostreptococcaceae bacterium]
NVIDIKEEIVSGESISHRPKMLELLEEIKDNKCDAVLVMDIDRLGRGNMQDQGIILDTFKQSKTKIITPRKCYDLNDEFDEEYSEFEAFMARKELKLITRRMQRGRVKSAQEGNYLGTNAPFGYDVYSVDKRTRTLVPNDKSDIVRVIFDLYVNEGYGAKKIATHINRLGSRTSTGKEWYDSAILNIIKNKVYCGYIQWKKKEEKKSNDPRKKTDVRTRPREEWIESKGKHEPIVSEDIWNKAQRILKGKYHSPYHLNGITNPLAGIVRCKVCGASMVYRPYTTGPAHLRCYNNCGNKSSKFEYVENAILDGLNDLLDKYKLHVCDYDLNSLKDTNELDNSISILQSLQRELNELEKQKGRLFDFLERGIYDEDTFLERSSNLNKRISSTKDAIGVASEKVNELNNDTIDYENLIPIIESTLDIYHKTNDVSLKNELLKSIINSITYYKAPDCKLDDFELIFDLNLPSK